MATNNNPTTSTLSTLLTSSTEASAAKLAVCVVSGIDEPKRYPMYELVELSGDGAFLGGKLLLEQGESLVVELSGPGTEARAMNARVIDVIVSDRGGMQPGIRVAWSDLSDADKSYLDSQA